MQRVVREAVVAVIRTGAYKYALSMTHYTRSRWGLLITGVLGFCLPLMAAVLPEDRADVLYHSYSGGGLDVNGPSVLARKQFGKHTSVWSNYYVDSITSATIDVVTSASQYNEERTEKSLGIDYLQDNAIISLAYTNSEENDFEANAVNFGISQLMFGELTTISLGYARGWDTITATGSPNFEEEASRQKYRLSMSQVLTKNLLMDLSFETITDEGFLNNPYRSVSYIDPSEPGCVTTRCSESELYPNTRTSHAVALRALYYLPYRAAIKGEARFFTDTWGIDARIFELGYTQPWGDNWIFDIHYRRYSQTQADFYRDLFQRAGEFTYRARDKELSTFSDYTIGVGASYEFAKHGWGFIDKGSVSLYYDYIQFDYKNFRNLCPKQDSQGRCISNDLPGSEPLYNFSTNVLRFFVSIWY